MSVHTVGNFARARATALALRRDAIINLKAIRWLSCRNLINARIQGGMRVVRSKQRLSHAIEDLAW